MAREVQSVNPSAAVHVRSAAVAEPTNGGAGGAGGADGVEVRVGAGVGLGVGDDVGLGTTTGGAELAVAPAAGELGAPIEPLGDEDVDGVADELGDGVEVAVGEVGADVGAATGAASGRAAYPMPRTTRRAAAPASSQAAAGRRDRSSGTGNPSRRNGPARSPRLAAVDAVS
jgi:hypothetical protein